MLEIYTYNAGRGDCIRLRFDDTHNIFIDSGVSTFATAFRRICDQVLSSGETLDALILTHADDDHIGGILMNLRSPRYQCPFNEVWMNRSGAAVTGDHALSVRQNDEVYAELLERGITVKPMLKGERRTIAGATMEVVWPDREHMSTGMRREKDTALARRKDYHIPLSKLAQMPLSCHDTSQSNKCSVVFAFCYRGRKLLFTGDAWAEDVVRAKGDFDLIKLPHHGSVRNISEAYPAAVRSSNFLICTDGRGHPDKQTIAKLEQWYGEIQVYSPCDWWKKDFFTADDRDHKISYMKKEGLVIAW
jgi:Predicted hydrolase (metallo-beta-lactamase superfamily)